MKRLYISALKRLQSQLITNNLYAAFDNQLQTKPQTKQQQTSQIGISNNSKLSSTVNFKLNQLSRLSEKQLRTLLKIPCPIQINQNRSTKNKNNYQKQQQIATINKFKLLREYYQINQKQTCSKCQFNKICALAYRRPQSNNDDRKKYNLTLIDLITFLEQLAEQNQNKYSILRWNAGYQVVESLRMIVRDSGNVKYEAMLYKAVDKLEQNKNKGKYTNNKGIQEENIFVNRRYQLVNNNQRK